MNIVSFLASAKKPYMVAMFAMLSMLLVAYGPMTTYSQAQAVNAANLQALKDKVLTELNRRIANYKKTIQSLSVDVHVGGDSATLKTSSDKGTSSAQINKDGASYEKKATNGSSSSGSISKDEIKSSATGYLGSGYNFTVDETGIHADVYVGAALKDKVKQFMQKVVEGLEAMAKKVKESPTMQKLKDLASNIDTQYIVNQLAQVQAAVTQVVDSVTGAVDNLKQGFNNLQTQLTQLKACVQGLKSGETSVDASVSKSGSSITCGTFKVTSEEAFTSIQNQMQGVKSVMTTIVSVSASVVSLLVSLVSQFTTLISSLGSLGSLGNLANLGNLGNLSSQLGGGSGGSAVSGLMSAFSGVFSQVNLLTSMAGGAQGSLSSISNLINL